MATATWIKEELEQRGMPYEERHHPEAFTAQRMAQREHISGHRVAKVVVIMVEDRPMELILPASRRVRLDMVRNILRTDNLRLATEEEMDRHFTDCERGAIPPLRHWEGVDAMMDGCLRVDGDILFQAGTHRDAVRMRFDDWFALVNPRVELFSEPVLNTPRRQREEDWWQEEDF